MIERARAAEHRPRFLKAGERGLARLRVESRRLTSAFLEEALDGAGESPSLDDLGELLAALLEGPSSVLLGLPSPVFTVLCLALASIPPGVAAPL